MSPWPEEPPRMSEDEIVDWVLQYSSERIMTNLDLPGWAVLEAAQDRFPGGSLGAPGRSDANVIAWLKAARRVQDETRDVFAGWALDLDAKGSPPESFTAALGPIWEHCDRRMGTVNGLPRFLTHHCMHREDWCRIQNLIKEAASE